jgi:hypothetical protein
MFCKLTPGLSGVPAHCSPTAAVVSRDARTGMQNDKPKLKTLGVAESTPVPVTENVPTRSVAVSVEKLMAACAAIGPASNPMASKP